MSEIDQCYIHLHAAYLAFSAGNYAQSKSELKRAREIYHAKNRGYPPRGAWGDAFDDIVILRGKLTLVEKQRKNPKEDDYGSPIFPDALVLFSPDVNATSDSFSVRGAVYRSPSAARAGREGYFVHDKRYGGTRVFPLPGWETEVYVDGIEDPVLHFNAPKEHKKRSRMKSNLMRRNHHLSAGSFASGKVRVIRPFGLRKSGEDLYLVDGKALKPLRKNTGKPQRALPE